jgi:hypothetical protein
VSKNKLKRFSHVDLDESSSRPGVVGPRYVPVPGMDNLLGDTNTGCHVYPRDEEQLQVSFNFDSDTKKQDQISIVDG